MTNKKTTMTYETVTYRRADEGTMVQAYRQEASTPDGVEERWVFSLGNLLSANNLPVTKLQESGQNPEVYAKDDKERDALAEKLLDSVTSARDALAKASDLVGNAFEENIKSGDE